VDPANYGLGMSRKPVLACLFAASVSSLLASCLVPPVEPVAAEQTPLAEGPLVHMANGIKIGEVKQVSALVWVRLTQHAEANANGTPFPKRKAKEAQLPDGATLAEMQGAVPGVAGDVRVICSLRGEAKVTLATEWAPVDGDTDFAHTFALEELTPGCTYDLVVEGRADANTITSSRVTGSFRTGPSATTAAPASFCVVTGQEYWRRDDKLRGHLIYGHMKTLSPDFFVNTGDTLYYDKQKPFATTVPLARFKWNRFYGMELQREFHRNVGSWFIKDDHDTLKNDCWPGQKYGELTFARGLELFREQLPVGDVPYRRVRWGKHLEVWFLEGREFRSSNRAPDGPDKTILGAVQMKWLRETLAASDATFRVVVSATPIVGPDRKSKKDNHANANFKTEGDALRQFLASQKQTIVVCGDRHWQYATKDPVTGLREWCSGPTSDKHAGGFRMSDRTEMHSYLNISGGFLHVSVQEDKDAAKLVLRHYDPRGNINHEDVLKAQ